jgi:ABC-2 type transport system ATP-binding protein
MLHHAPRRSDGSPDTHAHGLRDARDLDAAGVLLDDLAIRRPSLDDVFLTLTGRSTGTGTEASESEQS